MHRGCTSDRHRHQGAWLLYAHDAWQLSVGSAGEKGVHVQAIYRYHLGRFAHSVTQIG